MSGKLMVLLCCLAGGCAQSLAIDAIVRYPPPFADAFEDDSGTTVAAAIDQPESGDCREPNRQLFGNVDGTAPGPIQATNTVLEIDGSKVKGAQLYCLSVIAYDAVADDEDLEGTTARPVALDATASVILASDEQTAALIEAPNQALLLETPSGLCSNQQSALSFGPAGTFVFSAAHSQVELDVGDTVVGCHALDDSFVLWSGDDCQRVSLDGAMDRCSDDERRLEKSQTSSSLRFGSTQLSLTEGVFVIDRAGVQEQHVVGNKTQLARLGSGLVVLMGDGGVDVMLVRD
jgi:hypothetical protein